MKKVFFSFFLFLFVQASFAQDTVAVDSQIVRKKVLVVPFNRFEFHTEISLSEIAEINEIEVSKVYDSFRGMLLNSFVQSTCEEYEYHIISSTDLNYLSRRVSYKDSKKPHYYASNLDRLEKQDLKRIMSGYDADLILFLNWYHIEKDLHVNTGGKSFSKHYIDYDLYSSEKERLLWKNKYVFKQKVSSNSISTMGLVISGLFGAFYQLPIDICNDLTLITTGSSEDQ